MALPKFIASSAVIAAAAVACTPPPSPPPPAVVTAEQQLPPGRIYIFHSTAQSSCPALDWHVVLVSDTALDGIIAWNNIAVRSRELREPSTHKPGPSR